MKLAINRIPIYPDRFRQFGRPEGHFRLITNADCYDDFTIEPDSMYEDSRIITYDLGDDLSQIIQAILEPANIVIISPQHFVKSPDPEVLGQRKIVAMACNSTPTSLPEIEYFLRAIERTDPDEQERFADRFFTIAEASSQLEIVNKHYGTRAVFRHKSANYQWQQQGGPLGWGEQQIAPSGEISALPDDLYTFRPELRLAIDGEIALQGYPIVHQGERPCSPQEQACIYHDLAYITEHAVIATINNGMITKIRGTHPKARPAVDMFEHLFKEDARYSTIWEEGHGFNSAFDILPGNHAANEVYGGQYGAIHFGLGLTPYTLYHLDIICPGLSLVGHNNEVLLGPGIAF